MTEQEFKEASAAAITFINGLKELGVKDSTIKLIFEDIEEQQKQLLTEKFQDIQEKVDEILRGEYNE